MAVFWQGPVKVTLETSPFPSGKLEEKENPAGVFQEGNVNPPPGQLATLNESLKAWPTCQMQVKPICGAQVWPPERARENAAEGASWWAFLLP